ncbi:MAG: hypothetical protein JXX28_15670 [Deltaproteobacteria bacterium]|nr:hypothetical protein [Deltaproteobacteria bacterium]
MIKGFAIVLYKVGIAATLLAALASPSRAIAEDKTGGVAPFLASWFFPGVGEWYNAEFEGGFPIAECVIGSLCVCVHLSSLIDAASGQTNDEIRFDFWSSPNS